MDLEEGDAVLCTVDRIVGTNVFVSIEGYGEGIIIFSEIAPGRIRNIRAYVVPKKKIICKILRISKDRIELSLRRVTPKEKKEVLEKYTKSKSYENMIKNIFKDKSKEIIEKIILEDNLYDFFSEAKQNPIKLNKIFGKETNRIKEILNSEKSKKSLIKREIYLKSKNPEGIIEIKDILGNIKDLEIKYLSAGKYSLKFEASDLKKADAHLSEILKDIEKKAKKIGIDFSIIKK